MRDYHKLRAFELADQLALAIYKCTKSFPKEEVFGLPLHHGRLLLAQPNCQRSDQTSGIRSQASVIPET